MVEHSLDYYRGSRLNALSNTQKNAGLTRPSRFNRNQAGFAVGGPIFLPRFGEGTPPVYDGRDRSFFFVAYQADILRSGAGLAPTITFPTAAGFAALATTPLRVGQSAASRQTILDQLNSLRDSLNASGATQVANSVTTTTVNGRAIEIARFNSRIIQPDDVFNLLIRIDQRIGERDNLTGRYSKNDQTNTDQVSNTQFGSRFAGSQALVDQNLALSETHVFSPRILNEFRFSYIRRNLQFPENDPTTPTTGVGTFFTIGGASNFPQGRIQNSYQFQDTVSLQLGRNTLKIGADIRRIQLFNNAAFNTKGVYTFNNFQDFINNSAFSFTQALQTATFDARQTQQFYFVQDDYRITPNLTLNFGLRYETAGAPFGFFGATDQASLNALVPAPVERDNNNFAPAFGFAYSPRFENGFLGRVIGDSKTVIRGGYRINYDLLFFNILTVNASNFPRVITGTQFSVNDQFPNVLPVSGAAVFNPLAGFVNTPSDAKTPYSQIYSLSVQREAFRSFLFEVGYSGSRSLNQVNQLQANPAILTAAQIADVNAGRAIPNAQARRLFPQFGSRTLIATSAQATYNAGFVSVNKRLAGDGFLRNLQFGVAYTFSKLLSNNDESLGVGAITTGSPQIPQDFFNINPEKSLSVFDRKHRFVANYLFEVPTPGFAEGNAFLRQIFGGFQISGVTSRTSGQPFTILTGVDSNGNGTATGDRPNFNPNGTLILDPVTGNLRSFTQNGVFIVPRGTNGLPLANSLGNGNLGRNTLRGPGTYNTNLSVQKGFIVDELRRFIIRADFLNAFNQDAYGNPINNLNNPFFGQNFNNFGARTITVSGKFVF